jgi:exosome complex RNA-binding protein Csl4
MCKLGGMTYYLRLNIINSQKILMLRNDYKVGDIVLAKDIKQQWWPAYVQGIVSKENKSLYNVTYLVEDQSREARSEELKVFEVKGESSKRAKGNRRHRNKAKYSSAISAAIRISKGKSTFEGKIFIKI